MTIVKLWLTCAEYDETTESLINAQDNKTVQSSAYCASAFSMSATSFLSSGVVMLEYA